MPLGMRARPGIENWTKIILVQSYCRLRGKVKVKQAPWEGRQAEKLDKSASFAILLSKGIKPSPYLTIEGRSGSGMQWLGKLTFY